MNIFDYNSNAWDAQVEKKDRWTIPVTAEAVATARMGVYSVVLTPTKVVPSDWLGDLKDKTVLGLASAGGQQMPLFAATGATVTSLDASARQLGQDRLVAEREGLELCCVEGDMADLSDFPDASFDLVFHPVSNCFAKDVTPVWREAYRVLRPGGRLLAGSCNPLNFIFDWKELDAGRLKVKYALPYSDLDDLDEQSQRVLIDNNDPFCFGHTLQDLIGGQLAAGFTLKGFYEDNWPAEDRNALARYSDTFFATWAEK